MKDGRDDFVELIERANSNFNRAGVPGTFLVDVLPFLKYLPECLPGTGFLSKARNWKKDTVASAELPYSYTKKQMVSMVPSHLYPHARNIDFNVCIQQTLGNAVPSFVSTGLGLSESNHTTEYNHELKWAAASMYAGTF